MEKRTLFYFMGQKIGGNSNPGALQLDHSLYTIAEVVPSAIRRSEADDEGLVKEKTPFYLSSHPDSPHFHNPGSRGGGGVRQYWHEAEEKKTREL